MKKIFLRILIATFVICALLGIYAIVFETWNDLLGKILLSAITLFGFSIPALICSYKSDKKKAKFISYAGIAVCFIAAIIFLLFIWEIVDFNFFDVVAWKIILICIIAAFSFGHICLILLPNSKSKAESFVKYGTVILSAVLDILLLVWIIFELEVSWRLLFVLIILIALGTILTPLLNKLNSNTSKK